MMDRQSVFLYFVRLLKADSFEKIAFSWPGNIVVVYVHTVLRTSEGPKLLMYIAS